MNTRSLKKHLKYIVPQMRLALIKEPGSAPVPIGCPEDIEKFVEPLKLYSDYVPELIMCPRSAINASQYNFDQCSGT